ncbi:Imm50 family immunity protein [Cohnella sp. GCM10027633]|uniref:Imm50 family immunity protein n=1 Tax=unclassified Cohnella TaxID=2636738 RepID=UPI003639917C
MWADALDEHQQKFLKSIFNNIPQLTNVNILELRITYNDSVSIRLDLPEYADKPPQKWTDQGYNTVQLQIDFSGVDVFDIQLVRKISGAETVNRIEIIRDSELNKINITLEGTYKGTIKAEHGYIQTIQGYINEI